MRRGMMPVSACVLVCGYVELIVLRPFYASLTCDIYTH